MAEIRDAIIAAVEESPDKPTRDQVQDYLDEISKYEKEFSAWEKRVDKILKRYRDEKRPSGDRNAKFNILWANVQTLVPATFARLPQPDVSRRFRDNDQVGRVASLILERALSFEIEHYSDYRATMKQSVYDRFLGGRGTAWARYEPHFKPGEPQPADSGQVTEDSAPAPVEEQLDYECAPIDYVHWKDFGHSIARTWEEVGKVWRAVYMNEEAVKERFPQDKFPDLYTEAGELKIPFDATPEDLRKTRTQDSQVKQQALIYELWDKERGVACWFSKSMAKMLDEREDPLKLQEFFPCPRPLYATTTNETLVPVPDFTLYQDQASELDCLADKIDGLSKMLQLKGVYDSSADSSLARLFTEGENGTLLPVKNWQAFAEKNGLKGQIDVYDLTPIVKALEAAYKAMDQIKNQVYEIMGISDIIRGASNPNETLGAQEMKGQYASMRLRSMQSEVARYATDILQLKAQIMCGKFNPQTLSAISAVDQLSDADKKMVPQALALLVGQARMMDPAADAPNPLRSFRIEVNADSMIQMDEGKEKQDRIEFLTAVGGYMEKALPVVQMAPQAGPIVMELLKFGVTGFKVGKTIEGKLDDMIDKLLQAASQPKPPPPPDPKIEVAKIQAQAAGMEAQSEAQLAPIRAQAEQTKAQAQVITSQNDLRKAQVIAMTPPPPQQPRVQ